MLYYHSGDGEHKDNWTGLGYVFKVELIGFSTDWVLLGYKIKDNC